MSAAMRRASLVVVALASLGLSGCVFITRSSVSSSEAQPNGPSEAPSTNGDGRLVAFASTASNLVPSDTNGSRDIFVRDHQSGDTHRVSVSSTGGQANSNSFHASMSGDGRYIAFASDASMLVASDTNGQRDTFVHDRNTGVTQRVSVSNLGVQGNGVSGRPSISGDGRFVAFDSSSTNLVSGDTNGASDVFVRDRSTGLTQRVSVGTALVQGNGNSGEPSISDDGLRIAFASSATNLVSGDTNGQQDSFVHDRATGVTQRLSVSNAGVEGNGLSGRPSMSADGRYVTFPSAASNLVADDTNGASDAFIADRNTGTIERVSVSSGGGQGAGSSWISSISDSGRYVAFESGAPDLVGDDTNGNVDVFVRDRTNGVTQRVSLARSFEQANGASSVPSISGDGRYVGFQSDAANLVGGDTNGLTDVFLKFALAPRPLATVGDNSIDQGTTDQFTFTGSWFDPNVLRVFVSPSSGVTVDSIAVQDPNTTVVVTITVAGDAEPSARDVLLVNPGNAWDVNSGGGDKCAGCLVVAESPPPPPAADGLDLPGTTGSYAATPDSASIEVTGDIDVRAHLAPDDWTPDADQTVVGKWATGGTDRSWSFQLTRFAGQLKLVRSNDGTAVLTAFSGAAPPGVVDGQPTWVRVTVDQDDGAGRRVTTFYSSSDGTIWSPFSTVIGTNPSPFHDSAVQLEIGSYNSGNSFPFAGIVYRVEVRDGVDGPAVASPDFRSDPADSTQRAFTDAQENPWQLVGDAALVPAS